VEFTTTNLPHYPSAIQYAGKFIKETIIKFLGIRTDNHLTWWSCTEQTLPNLRAASLEVKKAVPYLTYRHSSDALPCIFNSVLLGKLY
jgi:hypothetical protein